MRRALVGMQPDRFEDLIALVALYRPGPMANIPALLRRKLGEEETRLHPSAARADPEGDLRRHHLPGAGDADRARSRRLHARRGRSSAPRHGQEDQGRRWSSSASASSRARSSAASRTPTRWRSSTPARSSPSYGFNKSHSAPYALITYQTAYLKANYPGRVPGRVDDARHGQHRQAQRIPPGGAAARHRGGAARRQPLRRRLRGRATAGSSTRSRR